MARYNATFTSVWDGGIEVNSRCYASKQKHLITRIRKNDIGTGEEMLDILKKEYVTFDNGETYQVCPESEMTIYQERGIEVYGY